MNCLYSSEYLLLIQDLECFSGFSWKCMHFISCNVSNTGIEQFRCSLLDLTLYLPTDRQAGGPRLNGTCPSYRISYFCFGRRHSFGGRINCCSGPKYRVMHTGRNRFIRQISWVLFSPCLLKCTLYLHRLQPVQDSLLEEIVIIYSHKIITLVSDLSLDYCVLIIVYLINYHSSKHIFFSRIWGFHGGDTKWLSFWL